MSKKIALVTGAMGGLGTAICQSLAKDGFKVVANCLPNFELKDAWLSAQRDLGFDFAAAEGDVSNYESCAAMVAKIEADVGPIDVLVNNAGITATSSSQDGEGPVGCGDQHQPEQPVQRHPPRLREDGRARLGSHHQHLFGQWRQGSGGPDQLLDRQGRRAGLHQGARRRAGDKV